jgi:hypothetical protein
LFENRSGNDFDQIVEKFFFSSLLSVEWENFYFLTFVQNSDAGREKL